MKLPKSYPLVMGILNVTPDSFYDGGRYQAIEHAVEHAKQMVVEGADIIDIGGESTRPGAKHVSVEEEIARVIPLIKKLRTELAVPLSIDSRHAPVIQAALEAGVDVVNDVSGLADMRTVELVASFQVPVCLMHMQGTPANMQARPFYTNVVQEIYDFFLERIEVCEKAGILRENILIDPGFGFGKLLAHNLTLLGNLAVFNNLGCPLLVGLSRKSMFGEILNLPVEQRLFGSLAGAVIAAMQGAAIIRTHDVKATKEALAVVKAIKQLERGLNP